MREFKEPVRDFEDDFMPEISDANNSLLRRAAGDEPSMSTVCESHTVDSDSDNSESLGELGMDAVPCDYDDSPTSSSDECALLPSKPLSSTILETPASNSMGSALRFRSHHFTRGSKSPELLSSSSDEEGISTGLDFKNVGLDQVDSNKSRINSVLVAVVKDSGECLESWMAETQKRIDKEGTNPTYSDSSIDSEFEIIDHD